MESHEHAHAACGGCTTHAGSHEPVGTAATVAGLEELALKSTEFYAEKIGLSADNFKKPLRIYTKLGQYDYCGESISGDLGEKIDTNTYGNQVIYIGQLDSETNSRERLGISVDSVGNIFEGHWKNDVYNGVGRTIWPSGGYYIGEFKDGEINGYGEKKDAIGRVYVGNWKDGHWHGQGTLTYPDGRKEEGVWEMGKLPQ